MKIFIILAFIWGNAFNALSQNDSITTKIFSIAELQADLDTLYKWVNETHPSLYTAVNRQQADAYWKTVKKSINRPMTRMEFSRIAVPVLTQYKDGHMGLTPEFDLPEFVQYKKEGGKLFPLKVMIRKNRIWCVANYLQNGVVVPGDEILAINGKSAEQIVQELLPVWPADDEASNEVIVSRLFSFSLWLNYGWGFESAVTVKKTNGKVSVGLKGLAADEYLEKYFSGNKTWNLDLYPDHNLAVITSCAYNASSEKSRRFLDSAFAVIKSSGVQHLAFDIRNNGGGNSTLGRMLLGYVSQKPSTSVVSKAFRSSSLLEQLPAGNWLSKAYNRAKKEWKPIDGGFRIDFGAENPMTPENKDLLFFGKFYLLTSPRTFSSAHMTAMEVKCYQLGTIIGEPTGERLNLTGEIIGFSLPNTQLTGIIPTAGYSTACGDGNKVGVQPDIYLPVQPSDLIAGRDVVLDKVKSLSK